MATLLPVLTALAALATIVGGVIEVLRELDRRRARVADRTEVSGTARSPAAGDAPPAPTPPAPVVPGLAAPATSAPPPQLIPFRPAQRHPARDPASLAQSRFPPDEPDPTIWRIGRWVLPAALWFIDFAGFGATVGDPKQLESGGMGTAATIRYSAVLLVAAAVIAGILSLGLHRAARSRGVEAPMLASVYSFTAGISLIILAALLIQRHAYLF
jgi:hypothetical protein